MARNVDNIGGVAQVAQGAGSPVNRRNLRFQDGGGVIWTVTPTGPDDADVSASISGGTGVPTGTVLDFAGTVAPPGYLLCDGAAYGRTGGDPSPQPDLFAAIGTTWGVGDGSTTFNVPNLARRVTVGSGGSPTGVLGNAVGNVGGAETHTLSQGEMPSHNHSDSGHAHNISLTNQGVCCGTANNGNSFIMMTGTNTGMLFPLGGSTSTSFANISNTGGGGAHNNMQPSAVMQKIIKT